MLKFILTSLFVFLFSFSVYADHNTGVPVGDDVGVAFLCLESDSVEYVLREAEKDNAEKAFQKILISGECIQLPGLVKVKLVEKNAEYTNIDEQYIYTVIKVVDKNDTFYYSFIMEEKGQES